MTYKEAIDVWDQFIFVKAYPYKGNKPEGAILIRMELICDGVTFDQLLDKLNTVNAPSHT